MPKITAITIQRRDSSRCNISIDGRFAFTLTALEVSELGVRPGQELSEPELDVLRERAERSKAYEVALRLISVRRRSALELRQSLVRRGYAVEEISQIIERLTECGLLDDLEFALAWVADRNALKPRSRRQLEQELMQKGIAADIRLQALAEQGNDELTQARRIADKKRRTGRYDAEKLTAFLMRQGFSYDIARQAVEAEDSD